jgi:hypothetical protein
MDTATSTPAARTQTTAAPTSAQPSPAPEFAARVPEEVLEAVRETEGWLNEEEVALLYLLAKQIPAESDIVEVGSYRGRSTVALALGARHGAREQHRAAAPVFAIEPHETFTGVLGGEFGPVDRGAFYGAMLRTGCFEEVRLVNLTSVHVAPAWRRSVGLLWIDGDHRYDAVADDVLAWSPHLQVGAAIVFAHAVEPGSGPHEAVDELLASGHFKPMAGLGPRGELGKLCVLVWTPQEAEPTPAS